MINQQQLSGKWHEVRDKLKQRWDKLTDDDLRNFDGNLEQLVGQIEQKTGESRAAIEDFLSEAAAGSAGILSGARDRMENATEQAVNTAREGYEALRQGYTEAERTVQRRPGQAVALAFGLGVLSGMGAALLMRNRDDDRRLSTARTLAERLAQQMGDVFANIAPDSFKRS